MDRRRLLLAATMGGLALVLAGCNFDRKSYEAVSLGMTADQVKQVLGQPRFAFEGQWIYTRDDPRDLTKVEIFFDAEGKVVGKTWQNPERPWENDHVGQVPVP